MEDCFLSWIDCKLTLWPTNLNSTYNAFSIYFDLQWGIYQVLWSTRISWTHQWPVKVTFFQKWIKQREITKPANWVDSIDKIISIYNNTEHSALNNLSPNQAGQTKYKQEIQTLNTDKAQCNKIQSDLFEGDRVRILDKKLFKKGSEPQYTSEIYTVESVHGKTIHLTNGLIKMRDMLLKVQKDTIPTTNNKTITQKITKEKTIERKLKADGVDEKNILTTKRRR